MLVQAGALALLVAGGGAFAPSLAAAVGLGVGTAMVYPTLIAAVSDTIEPRERAQAVGVYRFWRDSGFVLGALIAGFVADAIGASGAIALVAALTGGSGVWVAASRWTKTGLHSGVDDGAGFPAPRSAARPDAVAAAVRDDRRA